MEFRDVLSQRRMHRAFLPEQVPEESIERIVRTIRRAPSGGFSQGQSLVVVTDAQMRRRIADAFACYFAVGVVLYQCLTGEALFRRDNEAATLEALLHAPIEPPGKMRGGIPARLDEVVMRALARDRDWRYPTAEALRQDLEGVLADLRWPATQSVLAGWLRALFERGESVTGGGTEPFQALVHNVLEQLSGSIPAHWIRIQHAHCRRPDRPSL